MQSSRQRHAGGSTWGNHLRTTGLGFTSPQNNLQPLQKRQKKETFVFSFKFRPHPRNHASCMHMDCLSHEPQPKKGNSTPTKMGWLEASHQKQNLLKKGKPRSLASCGLWAVFFLFIWGGGWMGVGGGWGHFNELLAQAIHVYQSSLQCLRVSASTKFCPLIKASVIYHEVASCIEMSGN